jgi:hypothetical protein
LSNNYNRAGKSTRDRANQSRASILSNGLYGIAILGVLGYLMQNQKDLGISPEVAVGIFVLALVVKVLIERQVDKNYNTEMKFVRGARAEENIGDILENLSPDFLVIHDLTNINGNIDHIVIGRNSGIFLIETKSHHGTVTVTANGLLVNDKHPEKDFIKQTLRNTYWLRDEVTKIIGVSPWITPVIVFTNAFVKPAPPLKGIRVVNQKYLPSILQREGRPSLVNAKV